jgi:hypothetical protein
MERVGINANGEMVRRVLYIEKTKMTTQDTDSIMDIGVV